MKAIKIYTQDSKYFMEDFDNDVITELTEFVDDGKTLKLPENSANRKYCAVKKAISGIVLDYKETRTLDKSNVAKTPKVDFKEYYTEEEKAKIDELQAQIDKINKTAMNRAKAKAKENELKEALKALDPDTLKALLESIKA